MKSFKTYLREQKQDSAMDSTIEMGLAHKRYGESFFDNTTRPSSSPSRSPQLGPRHLELDIDPPKSEDDRTVFPRHHRFTDSEVRARAAATQGPTEDQLKRAIDDFYNNNPNETAQQDNPYTAPIIDTLSKISNEIYPTWALKQGVNSILPDDKKFDTYSALVPSLTDEDGSLSWPGVATQLGLYAVPIYSAFEGRSRPGSLPFDQRTLGPVYNRLANLGNRSLDTVIDPSSRTSRFLKWFGSGANPVRPDHPADLFRLPRMSDPLYYRSLGDLAKRLPNAVKGGVVTIGGGLAGEFLKDQLDNAGVFDRYGEKVRERMQQTQDRSPTLGAIHQGSAEAAGRVGAAAENLLLNLDPVNAAYALAGETEAERHRREKLAREEKERKDTEDRHLRGYRPTDPVRFLPGKI